MPGRIFKGNNQIFYIKNSSVGILNGAGLPTLYPIFPRLLTCKPFRTRINPIFPRQLPPFRSFFFLHYFNKFLSQLSFLEGWQEGLFSFPPLFLCIFSLLSFILTLPPEVRAHGGLWAPVAGAEPEALSRACELADCIRVAVRAQTEGGRFSRISSLCKYGCKSTVTLRTGGSGTHNIFFFFCMDQQEADEKIMQLKKTNKPLTQHIQDNPLTVKVFK